MTSVGSRRFLQRAARYRRLDILLAPQTRFFGAAALVNAALAELHARAWIRWYAGGATWQLLARIGARLERVNLDVARRLLRGPPGRRCPRTLHGPLLDQAIVMLEQREVQRLLREMRLADARAHRRALRGIDRMLRWGMRSAWRYDLRCPAAQALRRAVRVVSERLGRTACFAFYQDRECIGQTLVHQLRAGTVGKAPAAGAGAFAAGPAPTERATAWRYRARTSFGASPPGWSPAPPPLQPPASYWPLHE